MQRLAAHNYLVRPKTTAEAGFVDHVFDRWDPENHTVTRDILEQARQRATRNGQVDPIHFASETMLANRDHFVRDMEDRGAIVRPISSTQTTTSSHVNLFKEEFPELFEDGVEIEFRGGRQNKQEFLERYGYDVNLLLEMCVSLDNVFNSIGLFYGTTRSAFPIARIYHPAFYFAGAFHLTQKKPVDLHLTSEMTAPQEYKEMQANDQLPILTSTKRRVKMHGEHEYHALLAILHDFYHATVLQNFDPKYRRALIVIAECIWKVIERLWTKYPLFRPDRSNIDLTHPLDHCLTGPDPAYRYAHPSSTYMSWAMFYEETFKFILTGLDKAFASSRFTLREQIIYKREFLNDLEEALIEGHKNKRFSRAIVNTFKRIVSQHYR